MSTRTDTSIFTHNDIENLARKYFDLQAIAKKLPGEIDLNFHLQTTNGEEYILKIAHTGETYANLEMQSMMMKHLAKNQNSLALPKVVPNQNGEDITSIKDKGGENRLVRLLTWVPGRLLAKVIPHREHLLESLGKTSALLCKTLEDFDHTHTHRVFKWDNSQASWIKEQIHQIETEEQQTIASYFFHLFEQEVVPRFPSLRKSVIHNDANDYNVLVNYDLVNPNVIGVIDFGDAVYTHTINDLAIAIAYAILDKPDPLTAANAILKGFHATYPLDEVEIAVLFPLICTRLLVSVTISAINKKMYPENEYLLISEQPAWGTLEKLHKIPPALAHYSFRHTCRLEACPNNSNFQIWAHKNQGSFAKMMDIDFESRGVTLMNLGVGSLDLGNNDNFDTIKKFHQSIERMLSEAEAEIGIGGYTEIRPVYSTDRYLVKGNTGPKWRTVHLGLDIWTKAYMPIYCPWEGRIHSFQNNDYERDYGPTIIVEHCIDETLTFYTLYGHLSLESLEGLEIGMPVAKGQKIATVGDKPINGNWPPHLHFQIMLDILGKKGDFPGVAFPEEKAVWQSICPDPNLLLGIKRNLSPNTGFAPTEIIAKRKNKLGRSLSLSYQKPLKIVRGYLQYLYDQNGRRFLDTANNVPHVGHQHPKVVKAAQRQIGVLNTNTRYLHEEIIQFADELLSTFPPELSVCHFVNSGSEANELAIRMTRAYTGQKDMIVEEVGYHGNTNACIEISSYKFDGKGGSGAPDHIHVVPMPDTYRGKYRKDDPKAGIHYAEYIMQAINKVQRERRGIAGFICESILSCAGQIVLPNDYLKTAYQYIREAGGLCIADEVQVGFGRVGEAFWGFELQGVIPDIVTMGKPIGNGHPLAAVVCTKEVADAFANGMEYFNTFGGNPVSCSIGREVLKIVKEEGLQENARKVGAYLTKGLKQLQEKYSIIGDVRGSGLFLGFELVKDQTALTPAPEQAAYLANRMREYGILMSTDGLYHNVIKIKPPMCFKQDNVNFLLETLDIVLQEDFLSNTK